jgi:ribose-phosphate pyrophosphokinase
MNAICFSFARDAHVGRRLAEVLSAEHQDVDIHHFPDGETRVRLPGDCANRSVILVCGGQEPNHSALPLLFAVHAARAMGATKVGLVSPYLAYMRQDTRFHDGEAVSAAVYGRLLSDALDWIATVDPHLHRIHSLDEIFSIPALCISSMPAVSDWIAANIADPVIIGPDDESTQWASSVAQRIGVSWTALRKTRTGDRQVSLSLPDPKILRGRRPVIVDDIASSGRTLVEAVKGLRVSRAWSARIPWRTRPMRSTSFRSWLKRFACQEDFEPHTPNRGRSPHASAASISDSAASQSATSCPGSKPRCAERKYADSAIIASRSCGST